MLPTRRFASFLAKATETSRTASGCPKTRLPSAAAIAVGGGMEVGEGGGVVMRARRSRSRTARGAECAPQVGGETNRDPVAHVVHRRIVMQCTLVLHVPLLVPLRPAPRPPRFAWPVAAPVQGHSS